MTRLEEIKNEIAKEMQAEDAWVDMKHFNEATYQSPITEKYYNRIIERYARECCIATQKKCAENEKRKSEYEFCDKYKESLCTCEAHGDICACKLFDIDITSPENIVLI